MIPELGNFALVLALFVVLAQSVIPMVGAARRDVPMMQLAVPATRLALALVALAFGCLAYSARLTTEILTGEELVVELAEVAVPAEVATAVAGALGLQAAPRGGVEALAEHLGSQPAVLVLDNCEHLLEACAETAEHLLSACPELSILATSREPLMIPGERQWRAPPLTVPSESGAFLEPGASIVELERADAVRLFVERAQALAPEFQLTADNASAVAKICIRLEGIPLALELAAARVRVLSAQQILAHLDDVFRLLSGGSRVAPTRQQTLRATLDWSYDLLTGQEQCFFRRLAVFAGGFDLESAEYLTRVADAPAPPLSDDRAG